MKPAQSLSDRELISEIMGGIEAPAVSIPVFLGLAWEVRETSLPAPIERAGEVLREIMKRAFAEVSRNGGEVMTIASMKDLARLHLAGESIEKMLVLWLDVHMRLIKAEVMATGSVSQCTVYPREFVKRALELNASAMVMAHNHPSGDCNPSPADFALTSKMKAAMGTIDVILMDHIVVGSGTAFSMSEEGVF